MILNVTSDYLLQPMPQRCTSKNHPHPDSNTKLCSPLHPILHAIYHAMPSSQLARCTPSAPDTCRVPGRPPCEYQRTFTSTRILHHGQPEVKAGIDLSWGLHSQPRTSRIRRRSRWTTQRRCRCRWGSIQNQSWLIGS